MHLQKLLAVLSSLAVIGLSVPVTSQEENFDVAERNEPEYIVLARHSSEEQEGARSYNYHILTDTDKDIVKSVDKTIERALSRKDVDESNGFIIPTPVMDYNKRGDETIAWVQPPPTSKTPAATVLARNKRGDETVAWVQPPPTSKIPGSG